MIIVKNIPIPSVRQYIVGKFYNRSSKFCACYLNLRATRQNVPILYNKTQKQKLLTFIGNFILAIYNNISLTKKNIESSFCGL